jgi:23S rRNA pseudouridine2605 synthase
MKREGKSRRDSSKNQNTKSSFRTRQNEKKSAEDGKTRLNKFIANAGICSRREADKFIEAGVVTVNGVGVTEMGLRISPTDEVKFNGQRLKSDTPRYVLLNKPKNYSGRIDSATSTVSVMQLIKPACKERIYPVDKLNKSETGLLLFTNDTDLAKKLGRTKKNVKEIYQITLDKNLSQIHLENIREGVFINGRTVKLDLISYINGKDKNELGIENSNGGIKLVKQLFEKLGYRIIKLDRVFLGGLTKKDLPRKYFRHLTREEINILRRL